MLRRLDKNETDDIHLRWDVLSRGRVPDKKKEQGDIFRFNFKYTTTVVLSMHGGGTALNAMIFSSTLEEIKRPKTTLKKSAILNHRHTSVMNGTSRGLQRHVPLFPTPLAHPSQWLWEWSHLLPRPDSLWYSQTQVHVLRKHYLCWRWLDSSLYYASYFLFPTCCSRLCVQFQELLSLKFCLRSSTVT